MIIKMLLDLLYNVMNILLVFEIPQLPAEATEYIETAFGYIESGAGILANYTPLPYIMTLFGVLLVVDSGIMLYHFIMWIIRKIPMANVS